MHKTAIYENKKNLTVRKIPETLPLIEFTKKLIGEVDLGDTFIFAAQHILPTTYTMIRSWFSIGLKKSNLAVIGKCYSTNPEIFFQMIEDRIDVSFSSSYFNPYIAFDEFYKESIDTFLKQKQSKLDFSKFQRVIFLDDGGYLIDAASRLFSHHHNFIGVEQTSSGYNLLKSKKPPFPVINVARCEAKLKYESPIIANVVCRKLLKHLEKLTMPIFKILLLGNGYIGASINNELKNRYEIDVFDKDCSKSIISNLDFMKSLNTANVIIGCTGTNAIKLQDFHSLKHKMALISASSSDREFDAVELRKNVKNVSDCHKDLKVGNIFLLNCGFPINFDDDFETVDYDIFQLTRSLLTFGVLQASQCELMHNSFIPLDLDSQKEIIKKFNEIYDEKNIGVLV